MKLPSLNLLARSTADTFMRFPFTLLSATLGTTVSLLLFESDSSQTEFILHKLLLVAALGLPLFTVQAVFAEKRGWNESKKLAFQGIGLMFLAAYFFSLPESIHLHHKTLIRFILLNIGLHFLVAFLPFLNKDEIRGFWQFNKTLFVRFLTAVLYSGVLYLGLTIALQAIEHLFGVDIQPKRYGELWVMIAGLFNTWFFLAGVPSQYDALNRSEDYPKGLKIFTQYVLLPLVFLYLIILYAYEVKILFEWSWPKGWVSHLVLWFSVSGILSLLLIHPLQNQAGNRWIRTFSTWFFRALVPLMVMLTLAIFRRISDYGITENRYFVMVQALALGVVIVYFIFSRRKDIRILPMILCGLAFLSAYGPWSAFSVSLNSQTNRLDRLLSQKSILVDGKIRKVDTEVSWEDQRNIGSIIRYLDQTHGFDTIQHWFDQDLSPIMNEEGVLIRGTRQDSVLSLMGLRYIPEWERSRPEHFNLFAMREDLLPLSGYDFLIRNQNFTNGQSAVKRIGEEQMTVRLDKSTLSFEMRHSGGMTDKTEFDLSDLISSIGDQRDRGVPQNKLSLAGAVGGYRLKMLFANISGQNKSGTPEIEHLNFDLLIANDNN